MRDGEAAVLRREIATLHAGLDEAPAEIKSLKEALEDRDAEIARLNTRLACYEAPGMPTSQPSLYNARRAAFRESRGEDPVGSPGDRKESGGGGPQAASCEGGKKRPPPPGGPPRGGPRTPPPPPAPRAGGGPGGVRLPPATRPEAAPTRRRCSLR
ncbi:MAG: hypothetical protein OXK17_02520, partial [Thaumarchaeota archaeon]|nr:hypothetical protein [Nitrososphaerota archaeon]